METCGVASLITGVAEPDVELLHRGDSEDGVGVAGLDIGFTHNGDNTVGVAGLVMEFS